MDIWKVGLTGVCVWTHLFVYLKQQHSVEQIYFGSFFAYLQLLAIWGFAWFVYTHVEKSKYEQNNKEDESAAGHLGFVTDNNKAPSFIFVKIR